MSFSKEDAERYVKDVLNHIASRLPELERAVPDLGNMVIVCKGTVGGESTITPQTREQVLSFLEGDTSPDAVSCAQGIKNAAAKDEIPCVLVLDVPGLGPAVQVVSLYLTPRGMQQGGDA